MINPNIAILQQMVDRDIGNIYENVRGIVLDRLPGYLRTFAVNYISNNEQMWLSKLDEYSQLIVNASFPSVNTTLEEAILNANKILNEYINHFLITKLEIPENVLQIVLPLLFGAPR